VAGSVKSMGHEAAVGGLNLSVVELRYWFVLTAKRRLRTILASFPWATAFFVILCSMIYKFDLLHWNELNVFEQLVFHPIVHLDNSHILGNMVFGIAIIGTLIESWMIRLKRIVRYGLLVYCYFVSLGVVAIWRVAQGWVPEGSSGLIMAGLGVVSVYYLTFHEKLSLKGWNSLGPFAFGFSFAFLAQMVLTAFLDVTQFQGMILHLSVFLLSCVLLSLAENELSTERIGKMLQKG
jgi:hypothetical protein